MLGIKKAYLRVRLGFKRHLITKIKIAVQRIKVSKSTKKICSISGGSEK